MTADITTQGASLAPCPFCGSADTAIHQSMRLIWIASCNHCEAQGPVSRRQDLAVAAWNRRAPQPPAVLVPLTDEQIASAWRQWPRTSVTSAARAIEFMRFCGIPGAAT